MSVATAFIPRVARIELVPVQNGPMQFSRRIDNDLTLVGSGDVCDICLTSDRVAAVHAAILRIGPTVYLCDLGSPGGTSLNDERIRCERITQGAIISIGPTDFRVEMVGDAPAEAPIPAFTLHCAKTELKIPSKDGLILIGSDAACDLVLGDTSVAGRHAMVAWTTHGPMVRDLVGGYSIRRNGGRISAVMLGNGDTIGVGPFELMFETDHPLRTQSAAAELSLPGPELVSPKKVAAEAAGMPKQSRIPRKSSFKSLIGGVETGAISNLPHRRPRGHREISAKIERPESEPLEGVVSARLKEIDQSSQRFKARVAAAQQALDERAQKLWDGLNKERERLTNYHGELHQKARELLQVAMDKTNAPEAAEQEAATRTEAAQANLERVFGGHFQPAAATRKNGDETVRAAHVVETPQAAPAMSAATVATVVTGATTISPVVDADVQQQAGHLVELVRCERQEMEASEGRLDALRFDIERLRTTLLRGGERHQGRKSEVDSRMQTLRRSQQDLALERGVLSAKLRQVEAKQEAIEGRIVETQRQVALVEEEARQIAAARQEFEQKRLELRTMLESERRRLALRQAELQDKAAELARLARQRRESIETRAAQEQAALAVHEKKIQAQRLTIEEMSRGELDRTATELEQVLNARLNDIEAEIIARQSDLNKWMECLIPPDIGTATTQNALAGDPALELLPVAVEQEGGRLVALQREIGELQNAILGIGGEALQSESSDTIMPPAGPPKRRWSTTMKTRLSEKIAGLRTTTVIANRETDTATIPLVGEGKEETAV